MKKLALFYVLITLLFIIVGAADYIPDRLTDLVGDVLISSPADTEVLTYNATSGKWENMAAGAGSGDVTDVGDCTGGACFDGTSDGGTWIKYYDAQGAGNLTISDLSGARTWRLPDETGTLVTNTTPTLPNFFNKTETLALDNLTNYLNKTANQTKSFSIYNITNATDIMLWQTPRAITIQRISGLCVGGTNATLELLEYNATGESPATINGNFTIVNGTEYEDISITNGGIDAGDWVGVNATEIIGAPPNVAVTIDYNE